MKGYCQCIKPQTLKVVLFLHNVPSVNGYPEREVDCVACQLLTKPQKHYDEVYLCEKELVGSLVVNASSDSYNKRFNRLNPEEIDYYITMSESVMNVRCNSCTQVFPRPNFSEHMCITP